MAKYNKAPYDGVARFDFVDSGHQKGEIEGWIIALTNAVPTMTGAGVTTGDELGFVVLVRDGYEIKRAISEGDRSLNVTWDEDFSNNYWANTVTDGWHPVLVTVRSTTGPVANMNGNIYLMAGFAS